MRRDINNANIIFKLFVSLMCG